MRSSAPRARYSLGGDFEYTTSKLSSVQSFDSAGVFNSPFPGIDGIVNAIISDGAGGWYVGGYFFRVDGVERVNLARMRPDGSLDPDFDARIVYANPSGIFSDPNGDFRNRVASLALVDGKLFVSGDFAEIGGQARNGIAAIDPETGDALDWTFNHGPGWSHLWLRQESGYQFLYVVNGALYTLGVNYFEKTDPELPGPYYYGWEGLFSLDTATGYAEMLTAYQSFYLPFFAYSSDTVYLSNREAAVSVVGSGRPFQPMVAISLETGEMLPWAPVLPERFEYIYDIAYLDGVVYAATNYTVHAYDAVTGALLDWSPQLPDTDGRGVRCDGVSVSDGKLVVVSEAKRPAGFSQYEMLVRVSAVDPASGASLWASEVFNLEPRFGLKMVATGDGGVLTFGDGLYPDVVGPLYLGAYDAATGEPLGWNIDTDGPVYALKRSGDYLYVGGTFKKLGGENRKNIGAINLATGAVTPWNPGVGTTSGKVQAIAVDAGKVYIGGEFDTLRGAARANIGAVDAVTGNIDAWDPSASGAVTAMLSASEILYVSGDFDTIGGAARGGLAALDAEGVATAWDPAPVDAGRCKLYKVDDRLYVNGAFEQIAGMPRYRVAAFDLPVGTLSDWQPDLPEPISEEIMKVYAYGLVADASTVYMGTSTAEGYIENLRYQVHAFDAATGDRLDWQPLPGESVTPQLLTSQGLLVLIRSTPLQTVRVENLPYTLPDALSAEAVEMADAALRAFYGLDTNGDGALSEEDLPAAGTETFAALDRNRNGQLEVHELIEATGSAHVIHRADLNADGKFELTELLRVVQLYNAGGYACDDSTEDGYRPIEASGAKGRDIRCLAHTADFQDSGNGAIELSEMLRVIQIFSLGGYIACEGQTDDGFCLLP
ncbi:MAG: PQQ-binding-like beta-propeller repeat protein [Candidatus Hydrogenedens sp.]|nr:PQQ-binding-like beta-propeller repeat protein [Candidatus Hydrogenedens sp.]